MEPQSGIYMFTNTVNGSRYIGSAQHLRRRYNNHLGKLKHGNHANIHFQRAYNLHGIEAFAYTILEYVDNPHELIPTEQKYLDELKPEYNIATKAGSNLGLNHTPETRVQMSRSKKGKQPKHRVAGWNKDKPMSEAHKRNASLARMGKPHPKRPTGKPAWNRGIPSSAETRAKQSAAKKGIPPPNKGKRYTPEGKAQMLARKRATIAAKKASNQASLWDTAS